METFSTHILDSPSSRGLWNGYVCPNDYWWLQPPTSARVYTLQINGNWLSKPQLHIQARRHLTLLQIDRSYSLALAHPGFFLHTHKHTTAACIKSQDRCCPLHFLFPARIAFASHLHVHPPFPPSVSCCFSPPLPYFPLLGGLCGRERGRGRGRRKLAVAVRSGSHDATSLQ